MAAHKRYEPSIVAAVFLCACPNIDKEVIIGGSAAESTDTDADEGEPTEGPPERAASPESSFFIGESLDFSGPGACTNTDLNEVTKSLRVELEGRGWSGLRFVDQDSWPEDFAETSLFPASALDQQFADDATLAVYAGHGNVNQWQWGTPSDAGACLLSMTSAVRLGSLAGDRATVVMSLTSCTGMATQLWPTFGQTSRVRQILAYHNSPAIWGNQPRKFLRATADGLSDRSAWLSVMANKPGFGHNSPAVLTVASTPEAALAYHSSARLASLTGLSAPNEDADGYVISYLDYGCGGCGCPAQNLDPLAPVEWLDLDAAAEHVGDMALETSNVVSRLRLERSSRTPDELALRVAQLLEAAQAGPAPEAALGDWAAQATGAPGPFRGLQIDRPDHRAWVFYAPADDDLMIVIEREDTGAAFDESQAADSFEELTLELTARGLVTDPDIEDRRVGVLTTVTGSGGVVLDEEIDGWRFGVNRDHGGLAILDAGLSAVIGTDGRPAMVRLTDVSVEEVDSATLYRSSAALALAWLDALHAHHRPADAVFIESLRWAYVLPPAELEALVEPRVIINYVLGYDGPEGLTPSRQNILSLSLIPELAPTLLLP